MAEVINLGVSPIASTNDIANHAFFAYEDSSGKVHQLHGGGSIDGGDSIYDNVILNVSGFESFGILRSRVLEMDISSNNIVVTQIHGKDLSKTWSRMVSISIAISAMGKKYDMINYNSNTMAATIMHELGVPTPLNLQQYIVPGWRVVSVPGYSNSIESNNQKSRECFPADTLVLTAFSEHKAIYDINIGDSILAFDPTSDHGRGALVPRRVTRIYRNMTTEWIRLSWMEDGEARELVTTPGHHFFDQFGAFPPIETMIAQGRATVVLASGELTEVTAERIVYSAETAHMFERAHAAGMTAGNSALQPVEIDAWQTYNFEVEEHHTYIAGGVRVHNISATWAHDMATRSC